MMRRSTRSITFYIYDPAEKLDALLDDRRLATRGAVSFPLPRMGWDASSTEPTIALTAEAICLDDFFGFLMRGVV
jgi:hypothetical protein